MRKKRGIRFLAALMSLSLISATGTTVVHAEEAVNVTYRFEAGSLTAKADKEEMKDTYLDADQYFKLSGTAKKRTQSDDSVGKIELGKAESAAVSFTVLGIADVTIEVSSTGGSNDSDVALLDGEGNKVKNDDGLDVITVHGSKPERTYKYTGLKAGSYSLVNPKGSAYNRTFRLYSITANQISSGKRPARKAWAEIGTPAVSAEQKEDALEVSFDTLIGYDGADMVTVTMLDQNGQEIGSESSNRDGKGGSVSFTPSASGKYSFHVSASRKGETDKEADLRDVKYVLPLAKPNIENATSRGNGKVTVKFDSVKEADRYEAAAADQTVEIKEDGTGVYTAAFENLTVGKTYTASVTAFRGEEASEAGTISFTVNAEAEIEWNYADFGSNATTDAKKSGYAKNEDGSVTVWNLKNSGKLVPNSTDGLAFYYTAIPADKNFTLSADVSVDEWTYTNGQEGFGLMAADRVGKNGDRTAFWNNSYMASITKVQYGFKDGQVSDDPDASQITMKLGIGSQEKSGVTSDNLAGLESKDPAAVRQFSSQMRTLETSCGTRGAGTYNIIGNASKEVPGTVDGLTRFHLEIQKNNTGYFVSYTDEAGNTKTNKYYEPKALEQIDAENVYAGLFAARTSKASFSNVQITTIDPKEDAPAEEKPKTYVSPDFKVISAANANRSDYTLQYTGNADGSLTVKDEDGKVIAENAAVEAGKVTDIPVELKEGTNRFTLQMTPAKDFHPEGDPDKLLSSYETVKFGFETEYRTMQEDAAIHVSPDGNKDSRGTKDSPLDLMSAVKFVRAGQTILLAGGNYFLNDSVVIARGIDGTAEAPITLRAERDAKERPVLNFNSVGRGIYFAGDYWNVSGIDVTKSANGAHGLTLSGSHCIFSDIHTYENGNTGFQVSRYLTTDQKPEWPSDDLIKNCTSYSNADAGYEDADGFAAKLTVGEGIVFDGCISYNNADDGWDLFAKVETGSIGAVTIMNSIAFDNGKGVDGRDEGNGNGFKMGGESMTGNHRLINCAAFNNKAKGIDSNSCPDIHIENSISFNNGKYNVALYTNDAKNTNFTAENILSYRNDGGDEKDQFKLLGTQEEAKVLNSSNYFMQNGVSTNGEATIDDSWFVSLDAPKADAENPGKVGEDLRNADGSICLGDFLKLSDKASKPVKFSETFTDTGKKAEDLHEVLSEKSSENFTYDSAKDEELTVEIAGEPEDLVSVSVDGKLVDRKNYTLTKGSVIIHFNKDFLNSLGSGKHTVEADFNDGLTAAQEISVVSHKSSWTPSVDDHQKTEPKTDAETCVIYRLYNPYTGEHLYTTDAKEYEKLNGLGWEKEGEVWKSPVKGEVPVYRLFNHYEDTHLYTTDKAEYDRLVRLGWTGENTAFFSAPETGTPVYRLYNPYSRHGLHLFTTEASEYQNLKTIGWEGEGTVFYGLK